MPFELDVSFRGQSHQIKLDNDNPTAEALGKAIERETSAAFETLKLVAPKLKRGLHLSSSKGKTVRQLGLDSGTRVLLVASTAAEIERLKAQKDDATVIGFEAELRRAALRYQGSRSKQASTLALPSGPYTFQTFEVWQQAGLYPPQPEALKLLHSLAADPGIVGVMQKHAWTVGLLSEMPPEGKVGVSAVCILGFNRNRGMEISLRLRTDDLRGFRKYERIRETLIHELAHMVWDEHDGNFKALNSQLLRECAALDWRSPGGRVLVEAAAEAAAAPSSLEGYVDQQDVMAATAASSGRALGRGEQPVAAGASPRAAAAAAALRRLEDFTQTASASTLADLPSTSGPEGGARQHEHHDDTTEAAEAAMRRLGTFDKSDMDALVDSMDLGEGPTTTHAVPQERSEAVEHMETRESHAESVTEVPDVVMAQAQADDPAASSGVAQGTAAGTHAAVVSMPGEDAMHGASTSRQADHAHAVPHASNGTSADMGSSAQTGHAQQYSHVSPGGSLVGAEQRGRVVTDQLVGEVTAAMREVGEGLPADDPVAQKLQQLQAAVEKVLRSCPSADALVALETVAAILRNVLQHPQEDRYRRLRQNNAAYLRKAGHVFGTADILLLAGFVLQPADAGSGQEAMLVFTRNDPGLLWLLTAGLRLACDRLVTLLSGPV